MLEMHSQASVCLAVNVQCRYRPLQRGMSIEAIITKHAIAYHVKNALDKIV